MGLGRWWSQHAGGLPAPTGGVVLARRVGAVLATRGYAAGEIDQFWRDGVDVAALELTTAEDVW